MKNNWRLLRCVRKFCKMGANQSGREDFQFGNKDVNFDHFHILRAIGKGSFGKVCIVQKKDSKQMFAMKYMNKAACTERDALRNVLREVELLTQLEHPFLVNLWFSFQDEEDLFMVSDLLLGGDLRYHIQHQVAFTKDSVLLMVYELSTALDYLHGKRILHRDIKPDNILLDEEGHAHITDFNIATQLGERELATSMSGTKPYMSPEIFDCAADACVGYSYPVDWWSLGIVAFEMVMGERPYDIHSHTGVAEVRQLFLTPLRMPSGMDKMLADLIKRLLCVSPGGRCSSLEELKKIPALSHLEYEMVFQKGYKPNFCPPKDHLNCDPTFELEEMIVETKPLHKKKKRLAKQKSIRDMQVGSLDFDSQNSPTFEPTMPNIIPEFITYNRYKELEKREIERIKLERQMKEEEWEKELAKAMGDNIVLSEKEDKERLGGVRTQDGCDILQVRDHPLNFTKSNSEDDKCYQQKENNRRTKSNSESSSKSCNDAEIEPSKTDDESCECGNETCEHKTDAIDSTSLSNKSDKTKYVSESDFLAIKKKHNKISFDMGLFNHKQKSTKNFSRAGSLKVNFAKGTIPESNDSATKNDTLGAVSDLSDNVKNRIAHSPKLRNSKGPEYQKASTFMGDADYQKTKSEVIKNYHATLCSSLKTENEC